MSQKTIGTLYGVGVGPGDPKLMTLRAVEVLRGVSVVFAASSPKNGYSLALNTAQGHIPPEVEVVRLPFPMTDSHELLAQAWRANAGAVAQALEQGRDAAFITIGDPLTYSTYGYLLRTLRDMGCQAPVVTVPGVTAYHAAAASLNTPLVESRQSLAVISGVADPAEIANLAAISDNIVIMKAYRQFDQIVEAVEALPEKWSLAAASQVSLAEEKATTEAGALKGQKQHYLTLVIAKRRPAPQAD
ncbi:precorrin-2 C20-methyltransferase [Desulfarculus baarsii DSM 2075]|uniref:Precorrin-2 C20-methyltransferase n=1 Tax=Desulfarculus baarsii (strain ATCC 33931 / DSM 2075 / LMG 7858 / VKM B-1802 / 2st14) TaxID=644282 RepID=E1QJS6_DESB2|nr:precorrin-2 C(20)-methyltransferase [Desulfarculus baarsii]ADK85819.1 precorrin-2 C20-methyltransferase [Desulfarculus baarsii DSM 2075]